MKKALEVGKVQLDPRKHQQANGAKTTNMNSYFTIKARGKNVRALF